MCSIVGASCRVVDSEGLAIDELAGNVATKSDRLSIAYVKAAAGTAEPWLTLHYDEWICCRSGKIVLSVAASAAEAITTLEVPAGKTVHIAPGTRFRPSFPEDTEYIPVCIPAFRPDRCIREDTTESGEKISTNLKELHGSTQEKTAAQNAMSCASTDVEESSPEILYHMTTVVEWNEAKKRGIYYPKTYKQDGYYTHATGVPSRLLDTANHFYQDVSGDWLCLQFTRTSLWERGIHVRDEEAMPVGDKKVSSDWVQSNWICPHVIGGIPVAIVDKEYPMTRDGTRYMTIQGLVE